MKYRLIIEGDDGLYLESAYDYKEEAICGAANIISDLARYRIGEDGGCVMDNMKIIIKEIKEPQPYDVMVCRENSFGKNEFRISCGVSIEKAKEDILEEISRVTRQNAEYISHVFKNTENLKDYAIVNCPVSIKYFSVNKQN